jgi:hypothetical protein
MEVTGRVKMEMRCLAAKQPKITSACGNGLKPGGGPGRSSRRSGGVRSNPRIRKERSGSYSDPQSHLPDFRRERPPARWSSRPGSPGSADDPAARGRIRASRLFRRPAVEILRHRWNRVVTMGRAAIHARRGCNSADRFWPRRRLHRAASFVRVSRTDSGLRGVRPQEPRAADPNRRTPYP